MIATLLPSLLFVALAVGPAGAQRDVDRDLARGREALKAGRFEEAARLLEEALASAPRDARGWSLLARARCAVAEQQAAKDDDGNDGMAQAEATIALAEEAARTAVEIDASGSAAWATLGHVLVRGGKFSEAIDTLYHAEKLGEPTSALLIDLSDALLMAREFAQENGDDGGAAARLADAEAALERATALGDGEVEAWRRRAEIAGAKGDAAVSARCYRRALSLRPGDTGLHEAYLRIVEQGQSFEEAIDFLTGLVDEPALSRWYRSRVQELRGHVAFNKEKKYDAAASHYLDAERDFKEAAKRDPALQERVDAYLPTLRAFRGRALTLAEKFPEAEAALLSALDLAPGDANALDMLHQLQDAMWKKFGGDSMTKEHWDEIRAFASKVAMVEPGKAENWNNWAFFAREATKYEESFQAYRRALALEPENPVYLNDAALILLYHLGRDMDRAEQWLRKAIVRAEEVRHDDQRTSAEKTAATTALGDAYGNLINVFDQSNRTAEAIVLLRELEAKLPKRSEVAHWKQKLLPEEWAAEQEQKAADQKAKDDAKKGDDAKDGGDEGDDEKDGKDGGEKDDGEE